MKTLVATAVALLAANAAWAATSPPSRVQVSAQEYSFGLSRQTVRAGSAVVELVNLGEDPHDLRLQRVGAKHVAGSPLVEPGDRVDLALKLAPGRYRLWCSVANHAALGMRATLVVAR